MSTNPNTYVYAMSPPSISEIVGSLDAFSIPNKIYRDAYYSNESDAPDKPREYAGLLYNLNGGEGLGTLDEWAGGHLSVTTSNANARTKGKAITRCGHTASGGWEYASVPPSRREVKKWLTANAGRHVLKKSEVPSQVR
jgi:DNA polymerase zeta